MAAPARWFASEHFGAPPDVITFGKGIGGGVVPLSGMVATRADPRGRGRRRRTGFSYGHTFSGYPLGCAVGCAVIDTVEDEGLVERSASARSDAGCAAMLEAARRAGIAIVARTCAAAACCQGLELRHPATGARFAESDARVGPRRPGGAVSAA